MKEIDIPENVEKIEDYAFAGCTGLTTVKIPNSISGLGISVFQDCTGLTGVEFSEGLSYISGSAFEGCSSLANVEFPKSLTNIGINAFAGCSSLTKVFIPAQVYNVDYGAFEGCDNLAEIKVAEGNKYLDSRDDCNAIIQNVYDTHYDSETEKETKTLTDVKLIQGCKTTKIPDEVTYIEQSAFEDCIGLTAITIPEKVAYIEYRAFYGCSNLKDIQVAEGNKVYDSRDNCNAIIRTEDNTLLMGSMATKIPADVTTIGEKAFKGCSGLTSIEIPSSVTKIEYNAFEDCTGLTSIVIPKETTNFEGSAFRGCTGLTGIKLSGSPDEMYYNIVSKDLFDKCDNITSVEWNGMEFTSYQNFDDYITERHDGNGWWY